MPFEEKTVRSDWMELSETMPAIDISAKYDFIIDRTFDWAKKRETYNETELSLMIDWVKNQRMVAKDYTSENDCPQVLSNQLNQKQRLAFDIIKTYHEKGEQILMIIIGTAGNSSKKF